MSRSSVFSTTENTNYARLCRLIMDVGRQVLRDTFDRIHPPATLHSILSSNSEAYPTLQSLRKERILNSTWWGKLNPTHHSPVSSASFDITLLMVLLRNICSLSPPSSTGSWDKLPLPGDNSIEANIVRIKYYRNEVYAHANQASVNDATFNVLWQDISNALLALGSATTYASVISRLKTECMDPVVEEHYRELLNHWKKDDDNAKDTFEERKDMVKKWKSDEGSTKEKLENMEEVLKDEDSTKDEVGQVEEMLKSKVEVVKDALCPDDLIDNIRQLYKRREGWLAPFPWCEEFRFHLDNIFTRLKMVSRQKEPGTKTDSIVNMLEIFKPHEKCSQPRRILILGQPGIGKSVFCSKLAYDWAKNCTAEDSFPDVQVLLLLKCRDIHYDLWEAIDDQLLPRDMKEEEKENFFTFVQDNQSNVLLVLDGLDESPTHTLPIYKAIIQERQLSKCYLVVTARHEAGTKVQEGCDSLLEIEGFAKDDAEDFICRFFRTEEYMAKKLLDKLHTDESLEGLIANPLNTAILCLFCEDLQGELPKGRTLLFLEIVQCMLRRYRWKKELPTTDQDLTEIYRAKLKYLGCQALNGLLNDEMYFDLGAFEKCTSDITELGFLSVKPGCSKQRPSWSYGFLHKSFQEFFAAFYLSCQLVDEEISPDSLVADTRYFEEFEQVLMLTCGTLAQLCEAKAMSLMASIASQINQSVKEKRGNYLRIALICITECRGTFSKELAHTLGSRLEIQSFIHLSVDDSSIAALAHTLEKNSSLKQLDFCDVDIGDSGAATLAEAMEINSTLTQLDLSNSAIGDAGVVALAKAMESNRMLTQLDLSHNAIGVSGAAALSRAVELNSTLTRLDLSNNAIGVSGAAALARGVEMNSTLTQLDLSDNEIGNSGAAALARGVELNSTLTRLDLSGNEIGNSGAAALAKALERNSTLVCLVLERNEIGDSGAAALAEAMK